MHNVIAWVKGHPKTAGGIFIGLLLLLFLVMRGGSSSNAGSVVVQTQGTDTAANTALQEAQLNAQVQTNAVNQSAAVQMAGINAAQTVQSAQSTNATNVALAQISTTADTTKYVTNLQAQVAQGQTDAAVKINDSQVSGATQIAQISAAADESLANITSEMNKNNNETAISLSGIAAGVANNQTAAQLQLGSLQSNNALAGLFNTNATNLAINGQNDNTAIQINTQNNSLTYGIASIASADQWGGGFVNPGIAAFLANHG